MGCPAEDRRGQGPVPTPVATEQVEEGVVGQQVLVVAQRAAVLVPLEQAAATLIPVWELVTAAVMVLAQPPVVPLPPVRVVFPPPVTCRPAPRFRSRRLNPRWVTRTRSTTRGMQA
jgi:hypothetical protein